MYSAYKYVQDKGGIAEEKDYPYKAKDNTCQAVSTRVAKITGYKKVSVSQRALESAIDNGPVTVALDASHFSSYVSGDFSNCGSTPNHAVVADGHTSTHWIVRNSWGRRWGVSGYIYLAKGNTCGIENNAYFPTV